MFPRYKIEYYFTFKEVMNNYSPYSDSSFSWYSILHDAVPYAPLYKMTSDTPPVEVLKDNLEDLLNLVYSRYLHHYIYWKGEETLSEDDFNEIALKLANVIMITYPKYSPLVGFYKAQESSLMSKIASVSNSKIGFNDTPQNGGLFDDDSHRSNVTESETTNETAGDTPINRLDEIRRKLTSIMLEWSNEFDRIFLEEGNV